MTTLIVGRHSSIGLSLVQSGLFEKTCLIDRRQLVDLMLTKDIFRKFLEENQIEEVIYLMVDRSTPNDDSEQLSTFNYSYPVQMWEVVNEIPNVFFIWVSSIFANDTSMVAKHAYLRAQNLAHSEIMASNITQLRYSRLYLSQLYGMKNFAIHQPFLYRLNDTIRAGQNIDLINGHNTIRNFINVRDVCRLLADLKSWRSKPNVSLLAEISFTWLEIAEMFKSFYESNSILKNIVDPRELDQRRYCNDGLTSLNELYKPQNLDKVIMNGEFE